MDILPTVSRLCETSRPRNPLDGIDIWPLLSGETTELDREALLYFDNVNLQCARWQRWKLHVARHNSAAYSPAPQGGRINLPLRPPELYDVLNDPDESYDIAAENPKVVAKIEERVERLMRDFPEGIRTAWAQTKATPTEPSSTGTFPRPAKKQ
jgi:arylsulfatase